jgi:ABC-type oligopeptide transport system substrate-binding subunit
MKLPPKRFLMVAAAAMMLSLSAACGAGGDKAAICEKATKALQEFGQTATTSSSGNFDAFNSAAKKLGSELETLAGQADGELKTTLSSMATAWGSLQVDTSDLAGSASKMLEASQQASEQTKKLVSACS